MRKIVSVLQAERERAEATSLPEPAAAADAGARLQPLPTALESELSSGAAASLQKLQDETAHKQQAWLDDGGLARYAIRGSEDDWAQALGGGGAKASGAPPATLSVKGDAGERREGAKAGKKARREGGGGGGGGGDRSAKKMKAKKAR